MTTDDVWMERFRERMTAIKRHREEVVSMVIADLADKPIIQLYERTGSTDENIEIIHKMIVIASIISGDQITYIDHGMTKTCVESFNDPDSPPDIHHSICIRRIDGSEIKIASFGSSNELFDPFMVALEDAYGGSLLC